jgi:N6-adenosine-specific RNA methylase IME4
VTLPRGPFQLIYADPPWQTVMFNGATRTPTQRRGPDHYRTMPLDELRSLPVRRIAADDAVLALWGIGSHLDQMFMLADAWGFSFVTDLFYWAKQRLVDAMVIDPRTGDIPEPRISMGYYTRKQVEPCWLFKRGKGLPVCSHSVRQLIIAPPREHSRKPEQAAEGLEQLFGDVTRLELFSRTPRAGWTAWGNEAGKYEAAV